MEFAQLIIIAILVEAIWEHCKMVWKEGKFSVNMVGSLLISMLVCLLTEADIFPIVGLNITVPFVGSILTGIVVSRGANFVNDLFSKLKGGATMEPNLEDVKVKEQPENEFGPDESKADFGEPNEDEELEEL